VIRLNLTASEVEKYFADLASSHAFRNRIEILDGNEKTLTTLTANANLVTQGAVQFDATLGATGVSRRLSLTVMDEAGKLTFESGSPAPQGMFINHFVAVQREDYCASLGRWVSVPVFHGPLTAFKRQGTEVSIEGMGKEAKLMAPYVTPNTIVKHKGDGVFDVIHDIAHQQGERHFAGLLDGDPKRSAGPNLSKQFTIPKWTSVWPHLVKLARSHNFDLFYNGRGQLTLRRRHATTEPGFVFTGDFVLTSTLPVVAFDYTQFRNAAQVVGATPSGSKTAIQYTKVLPHSDPLAPSRLAWNGVPQFLLNVDNNSHVSRIAKAKVVAEADLDRLGKVDNQTTFESLPVPVLEEHDVVRLDCTVENIQYLSAFPMLQWTLPLDTTSAMQVGDVRLKQAGRHHRRHRH